MTFLSTLVLLLSLSLLFLAPVVAAQSSATLSFSSTAPPLNVAWASYLSFNLDTGSLYNAFDFSDPLLVALTRTLASAAPTQLRIGGGAANDVIVTGAGGVRGNCSTPTATRICIDESLWDEINAFAEATGVRLVFDFNILLTTASGEWDSSNASVLLARSAARGYGSAAWQLGNEEEDMVHHGANISAATVAAAFQKLRALLAGAFPSLPQAIYGPDACCENWMSPVGSFLAAFVEGASGAIDAVTVHDYPLGRGANRSCVPAEYINLTQFQSLPQFLANYSRYVAAGGGRQLPLILGEIASTAEGGCDGLSNRFVAGFVFLYTLATTAATGVVQLNRQDIAGWSSETTPSNYGLLGSPGWANSTLDGPPTPHPDYFLALLWKQLMGNAVLNSTYAADADAAGFDAHVWCSALSPSAPVVAYVNMNSATVALTLAGGAYAVAPRTEFFVTSAPPSGSNGANGFGEGEARFSEPPSTVYGDEAFLNGVALVVLTNGTISPPYPFMGHVVADPSQALAFPPWSYGFVRLDALASNGFPACVAAGAQAAL